MGEKNYTKLRQRLGYKPTYRGRKYRIIDREAKKKMKAGQ